MKGQPHADEARGSKRATHHCHEHTQRLRLPACPRTVNLDKQAYSPVVKKFDNTTCNREAAFTTRLGRPDSTEM